MKPYHDRNQPKEDIQDNAYQIVAYYVAMALQAKSMKDLEEFVECMDNIYLLCHKKLGENALEEQLEELRDMVWGKRSSKNPVRRSVALDKARTTFYEMTGLLSDKEILFRIVGNHEGFFT